MAETEYITIPLSEVESLSEFEQKEKIIISLPRYTKDEKAVINEIENAKKNGFNKIECQNVSHIKIGQDLGLNMFGGFGLNIANSFSVKSLYDMGLQDCIASIEMKLSQISRLSDYMPLGIIGYGRLLV